MSPLRWIRRFIPISTPALALWGWRNRRELSSWASFGRAAFGRVLQGNLEDVVTEARLRAALTVDARTRGARGLSVEVRQGEAILSGRVPAELRAAAADAARRTRGIRDVRDLTEERVRRARVLRRRHPP